MKILLIISVKKVHIYCHVTILICFQTEEILFVEKFTTYIRKTTTLRIHGDFLIFRYS